MNDLMGIINLSGSTEKLRDLTEKRTIGSLPIGGRYRVIDFILSNMVNSGIVNVAITTQGKSRSIYDHLGSGRYWDLDRKNDGLFIFHPEASSIDVVQKKGDIEIYNSMLGYIKQSKQEYVFLTRSYMICNVDILPMLEYHKESEADITIMYQSMNKNVKRFMDCDTIQFSEGHRISSIGKNLGKKNIVNISMEMYIMKRSILIEIIEEGIHLGDVDHLKQCIFNQIPKLNVVGFPYTGYLACINSLSNYYKTNLEMLDIEVQKDLFKKDRLIYTKVKDEIPTKYGMDCHVSNSLISLGCKIEGHVENSVLSRGVHVKKGAIVRNSIVMQNADIGETANLNYMILDKNVTISQKKILSADKEYPYVIRKGAKV